MECDGGEKKKTGGGWNQKGGAETPETIVLWNEVEGESHHEQVQAKSFRKGSEAPGEDDDEEVESPKRKVIRVESEETQDYVREAKDMSREEAEEIRFVPSAISVLQKPLFRCDNRCSEKPSVSGSLRRW